MASDPNSTSIQDIINAAGNPLQAQAPTPPTLLSTATPSPALAPSGAEYAQSVAPKPTLGTNAELQAPAINASTSQTADDQTSGPSSITLPARTSENSAGPDQQPPTMLHKIGAFAADLAGAPQLADPNASPASKAQGIMNILRTIGNVGANATGSPQQKEQAIQRQGQANQLLQMQNEAAYHKELARNNQNKTAEQVYKDRQAEALKQQNVDLAYRKQNMVPDPNNPGMHVPATPDQTLANPDMQHNSEMWQAANNLKNSQIALDNAKTDVAKNQNPQFMKALQEKYYRDQTNYALAQSRLQMQQQSQNRQDYRDMLNLGQDMNGRQLTPTNAAPGMLTDANNNPVPYRAMSQYGATSQMKNVSAQAKLAAAQIPDVIKEVDDLKDSLGPVAGRWNEFMQGKIGTDNPAFAGLRADLMMQGTAVALAHARGRLPENLRVEFDTMMNAPQQTPENIKAVLSHIKPWLDKAGEMSEKPMNPPNIKPKAGAGAGLTPAQYLAQKNKVAGAK